MINWLNLIFPIPNPDQPPLTFFLDISFLADLKLKIKSTIHDIINLNSFSFYDFGTGETFIVLKYLRHCNYQKMKENMKYQRYEWPNRIVLKKQLEGASSIDTRPSRKMLTPDKWHMTCDTQFEKDQSVNQWLNEKGACKTAMAKTGLMKYICCAFFFMKVVWIFFVDSDFLYTKNNRISN